MIKLKRKLYSKEENGSSTGEKAGKAFLGVSAALGIGAGGHLAQSYHQGWKAGLVKESGGATKYLREVRQASKADEASFKNLHTAKKQANKIMDPVLQSKVKNSLNSIQNMKFARGMGKAALATAGIGGGLYLGSKLLKKKSKASNNSSTAPN